MAGESLQAKLEALQSSLHRLDAFHLPLETRAALQDAAQHLNNLSGSLKTAQEQNRLAALYQVSRSLGASLDIDEVLAQVMDAVIRLTRAERGFLVLLNEQSSTWEIRAVRSFSKESLEPRDSGYSHTVIDIVTQSGQGLVTTDARSDPRFSQRNSVIFNSLRSILCAPLLARGRVIGAIYVDNRAQIGLFTIEDLHLLEAFAAQAAIAIENARLYTRADHALAQRITELEMLARMDRELNSSLELTRVLEITRDWVLRSAQAAEVWIYTSRDLNFLEASLPALPPGIQVGYPEDSLVQKAAGDAVLQVEPHGIDRPARLAIPVLHASQFLGIILIERADDFEGDLILSLGRLVERSASAWENARLYQAVQVANQAKSRFVSVVTHELRIPMTSIKGYTDLLRQETVGPINEAQRNFLNVIRNNTQRMSALISDLSDISRIETGQLTLNCAPIAVRACIDEALTSLKPRLDERKHTYQVQLPDGLPTVYADPNRLIQILTNLLSNACKYTLDGGMLKINAESRGGFLHLEISDNGIGINPEDQKRLFQQFFRSDDPLVREQQGWGLGLNVTRRLVELMGGHIGVRSVPRHGTTIWFTLPIFQEMV